MNIRRFLAPTSQEALAKARAVFGEGTLILSNRAVENGVEVLATAEESLSKLDQGAKTSANLKAAIQARAAEETRKPKAVKPPMQMPVPPAATGPASPLKASAAQSVAEDTEQLAMSTLSFQDYVRERMLRRRNEELESVARGPAQIELPTFARKAAGTQVAGEGDMPRVVRHNPLRGLAPELPSPHMRNPGSGATMPQSMMNELQSVKNLIEERFNTLSWLGHTRQNPLHSNLVLKLIRSGYSPALARTLLEKMPQDISRAADSLRWITQVLQRNLRTDAGHAPIYEQGGVFALIGSTGVGKTTTAAKLAALCARKYGANEVGLITLDTYRIGGHEQLRTYGRMLGVVAHLAHDRAALQDMLGLLAGKKMVLIDTSGVAPRDARRDEILEVLDLPGVQRLLVANAGSHGDTLDESMTAFKEKGCKQLILSKLDEAVKLGPALDAVIRHKLVLRGITNGQRVPEDFDRADAAELIATSMRAHGKSAFDPSELDLDFFYADSAAAGHKGAAHA